MRRTLTETGRGKRVFVLDYLRDIEATTIYGLGMVAATCWPHAGVLALGVGAIGALTRGVSRWWATLKMNHHNDGAGKPDEVAP